MTPGSLSARRLSASSATTISTSMSASGGFSMVATQHAATPLLDPDRAHGATLTGTSQPMAKKLYTAEAHVTGDRMKGHGKTASGSLEVDIRVPAELGGEEPGTNPEELFAVGYARLLRAARSTPSPGG